MSTFSNRFWNRVRNHELLIRLFFVTDVFFLVLASGAYPLVEPGSAAHVLLVFDLLLFFTLLVPLAYLLYECRRRRLEEEKL